MYYLESRYYDPEMGRFLNADAFASTGQGFVGNNMFAYCLNNPVDLMDDSGNLARAARNATNGARKYLSYTSADAAARAFANEVYSASLYIRHEYGTIIYSKTYDGVTTYDYATPISGQPHAVSYDNVKVPLNAIAVATAHTHPNSNEFSGIGKGEKEGDIPNAINRGMDSYMVGPDLNMKKYSILLSAIVDVGTISPTELTKNRKKQLVKEFHASWEGHIGTCGFGCERMLWPTS